MFQTKIALIVIILFISFNILHICAPLPFPALDIPYINKYFHSYGKHFVILVSFIIITVTKNIGCFYISFGMIDFRHFLSESYPWVGFSFYMIE